MTVQQNPRSDINPSEHKQIYTTPYIVYKTLYIIDSDVIKSLFPLKESDNQLNNPVWMRASLFIF